MKFRVIPVVFTAALTSLLTILIAAKYQQNISFAAQTERDHAMSAKYASYSQVAGASLPLNFETAAESSVKAVVHIKTQTNAKKVVTQDPFGHDFFGDFFGQRQYYIPPQMGSGSGVVVSQDGYIVTNNHVVAGADQVTVTFNDRYTTQADVIGADPSTDIAVLKVSENDLAFVEFGNSDDVKLGQWVLAVGYPLSLDATVTAGIVSAKSRSIGINRTQARESAIESFIQTDAAVNPGNSGGALVNTTGQLIGINSAITSPTGSYAGYSYAIPANIVRKVVNDIIQFGSVQRGYLGIQYIDRKVASLEQIAALGLDRNDGVYIGDVTPGSGAANAGLQRGDFITAINGIEIHTEPQLQEQLARYRPGDNISVRYIRSGATYVTTVQLKNIQNNTNIIRKQNTVKMLGATFRSLTLAEKSKYGVDAGIMVAEMGKGSLSSQTNMRKGFVITSVNEKHVTSIDELQKQLSSGQYLQIAGFYPGIKGNYYYSLNDSNSGNEQ